MAARLRGQRNGARAPACCNRAAYKASISGMVWRNDLQKSCLIIARRAVCETQFKIARRKSRRENTRPKIGCVNGDNCRAAVSAAISFGVSQNRPTIFSADSEL